MRAPQRADPVGRHRRRATPLHLAPLHLAPLHLAPLRVAALHVAGRGKTMRVTLTDVGERIVACERCPRLRSYCVRVAQEKRRAYRDEVYWGKPVPGFGDPRARLLLVGLAPAAHGAN